MSTGTCHEEHRAGMADVLLPVVLHKLGALKLFDVVHVGNVVADNLRETQCRVLEPELLPSFQDPLVSVLETDRLIVDQRGDACQSIHVVLVPSLLDTAT